MLAFGVRPPALEITGFGAAMCMHFTEVGELTEYRDILADDSERLQRFLYLAMQEGVILVPDGRIYLSIVHDDRDIDETLAALGRVFAKL